MIVSGSHMNTTANQQTKATKVQQNESKMTQDTTQDSQILHSLPLWHRDTKKAERTPTTQVVAPTEVITQQSPHLSQQQEWTPHLT